MTAYGHKAGEQIECLSLAVELRKEQVYDHYGNVNHRVGFKIGGGIDQDPTRSPYSYPDTGIYITYIEPNSPAQKAELRQHDKILRVNGHDFTMLTHDHAVKYIKKYPVLEIIVARTDIPSLSHLFALVLLGFLDTATTVYLKRNCVFGGFCLDGTGQPWFHIIPPAMAIGTHPFQVVSAKTMMLVGQIVEHYGGTWKEMYTDADTFSVHFPLELNPQLKTVLVSCTSRTPATTRGANFDRTSTKSRC